ncbi:unnamed protein product [Pseudo-nitzschia multistriata]|uniref:Uncharacterized protein n=1 Tax=Pseudo-nitzschia multistriata TaxID=183589 RepID=A0A448ZB56_9STRA|nr:unnamed protein product [Pseudo-nitzschia multistriata]
MTQRIFDTHQSHSNKICFGFKGVASIRVFDRRRNCFQVGACGQVSVRKCYSSHPTTSIDLRISHKFVGIFWF